MTSAKSSKGNPASHRMGSKELKARRASSWQRGQQRKDARRKAQHEAEQRNRALREQGLPTPWEAARTARVLRRAAERAAVATARKGKS